MSLADMIAKQKAAKEKKNEGLATGTVGGTVGAGTPVVAASTPAPAGKLTFGVKKATTQPAQAKPEPASEPPKIASVSEVVANTTMSLDDLSGTEDEGSAPRESRVNVYAFDDEIPCVAPERALPEGLEKQQLEFVASVDSIYQIMHDPELFGGQIRSIMQELQENPAHMSLMADQDVHVMIRGLRSSMGLAKIKKAEKSVKGRAAKKAVAPTQLATTAEEMFNSEDW